MSVAVARQAFLYHNRRPLRGFVASDYPRGRWVDNRLGALCDITHASWTESIIAGTGTATITESGTQRIFTGTGAGTVRAFVGTSLTDFDTAKWYAFGANFTTVTGTWTNKTIALTAAPTDGEQNAVTTAAGRWCIVFQPSSTTMTMRLGIGCPSNETVAVDDVLIIEDPFVFELADQNDIPPEFVGAVPVIIPYDNPCSLASNVITQSAYGTIKPYKRSDVVLFAGDSFGDGGSEYPTLIRDAYQIEAHNVHVPGARLDQIGTQIASYIASPSTNAPVNLTARVCVMNGGLNDLVADATLETMQSRVNANIAAVRAAGMIPVVVSVGPWKSHSSWSAGQQTVTDNYNAWLLARTDILTVDIYAPLEDPSTPDTILPAYEASEAHPNSAGSAVIQARVTNVLKRIAGACD